MHFFFRFEASCWITKPNPNMNFNKIIPNLFNFFYSAQHFFFLSPAIQYLHFVRWKWIDISTQVEFYRVLINIWISRRVLFFPQNNCLYQIPSLAPIHSLNGIHHVYFRNCFILWPLNKSYFVSQTRASRFQFVFICSLWFSFHFFELRAVLGLDSSHAEIRSRIQFNQT